MWLDVSCDTKHFDKEATMGKDVPQKRSKVIQIDEDRVQQHLGDLVRGTVEEALNKLFDAETDPLCNAARYERTEARKNTRAGHYHRRLHTRAGEVTLNVSKLRQQRGSVRIFPPLSAVTSFRQLLPELSLENTVFGT
jgi:hypothetical protein